MRRALLIMIALLSPATAVADGWGAVRQPGAVVVMRHALAPGIGDPAGFTLGDCATQRNLDARGREQARRIGEAFRANGIAVDRVLTSEWCRARETADLLALAPVEQFPALNSFFSDRSTRDAQTEAVRRFLAARPDGERLVLVTHQVNVTALTGRLTRSGEMVVITVADDGTVSVRGEIPVPF